jgi:dihydroxyacetone kinase phosphotransfer subunit
MVNLLIVSHSYRLATGIKEFVDQVANGYIKIGAAGGAIDGSVGTSVDNIKAALQEVASPDGVLILVDFGSAVMSVQVALEMMDGLRTIISDAPLVEGAYLAASEAAAGANLEETAAAAMQARDMKKIFS